MAPQTQTSRNQGNRGPGNSSVRSIPADATTKHMKEKTPYEQSDTPPTKRKKTCYNAKELQEFKANILAKLEEKNKELMLCEEKILNSQISTTNTRDWEKGEADVYDIDVLFEQQASLNKFIRSLQRELVRIGNGTYGICKVTGELIPRERLLAAPNADMTVEAKEKRTEHFAQYPNFSKN